MSPEEQEDYKEQVIQRRREGFEAYMSIVASEVRGEGFLSTFGGMDIIFFGLAILTAGGVAGSEEDEG